MTEERYLKVMLRICQKEAKKNEDYLTLLQEGRIKEHAIGYKEEVEENLFVLGVFIKGYKERLKESV